MIHRIKGFKVFKDRYGKMRCYHRATGFKVDLEQFPIGSDEFAMECARINTMHKPLEAKPGTLGMLIKQYKKSPQWSKLKPKTQRWYESAFTYLKNIYDAPLSTFNPALIVGIRDKAENKKGWYFANMVKTTLGTVFSWGLERNLSHNPTIGIKRVKRPKDLARANRPWTIPELKTVLEASQAHFKPIIGMCLYTGADVCDVIALPKAKYKEGAFDFSRQKTGNPVVKPAPRELKVMLAAMPKHDAITLLANSYGKPWSRSGVDSVWHKLKTELEKQGIIPKGLTLKGLRHTHATMLREMGADHRLIADSLGDKSESMGQHYSRDADTRDSMDKVTKLFDKSVKLRKRSVKL